MAYSSSGRCEACKKGLVVRKRGRYNVCYPVCIGNRTFSERSKMCVSCPAGLMKMKDVSGTLINRCALKTPYD